MSWSSAEIYALAAKAARGAGAPAAQADRFGQVAALHLMTGRDAGALETALDALPAGPILAFPQALDSALAALSQTKTVVLGLTEDGDLLHSYVEVLPFAAHLARDRSGALTLQVTLDQPRRKPPARRIAGCETLVVKLQHLAERTFVPESETSRRAGAGAATSDND